MPTTTCAAVFNAARQPLEIQSFPLPELSTGEVLVRITCCTMCGSDLHTYEGRRTTPTPTVLGHEIMGEIVGFGPGEPARDIGGQPLKAGDRVTWSIAASCGQCFYCTHGIPQKCEHLFKYGHERIVPDHPLSGGLAEYCHLAPGTAIVLVPESLPDLVACPANCATATVAGALRTGGGCEGETVLVQGAGMLGLTACAMARSGGAREVLVSDIDPARLALAERFGASRCVEAGDDGQRLQAAVEEATDGRGVDLAIEVSGAASAMQTGLDRLRIGGRYVWVGAVFPAPPLAVSAESVVRGLLTIRGLHNYVPQDLESAIAFLSREQDRFPFSELVAKTFPLRQANEAVQYAIEHHPFRIAVRPEALRDS